MKFLRSWPKILLYAVIGIHAFVITAGLLFFVSCIFFDPPASSLELQRKLFYGHKIEKKIFVEYEKIPERVKIMAVMSEDGTFWDHWGFDFNAITEAVEKNLRSKKVRVGGSTISQQLVKTMLLFPGRSFIRKYFEAILTFEMELILSKNRIMELYLNYIEFGRGIFGIGTASKVYFKKDLSALTKEETASLITIIPSPVRFTPSTFSRSKRMSSRYNYLLKNCY